MSDAGACLTEADTHIDASVEDITAATDWLGKLKTGFTDAENSMFDSAMSRAQISGKLGDALDDYIDDLSSGCQARPRS